MAILLDKQLASASVYDLNGKCINENTISNGENTITFKNKLNSGIYLLRLKNNTNLETHKFIVNN